MLQPVTASNVPSPCVNVCRMNPQSGLCEGCLRTLDEIAGWSKMQDVEKHQVWLRLAERGGQAGEAPAAC